jgi:hypothetical protein
VSIERRLLALPGTEGREIVDAVIGYRAWHVVVEDGNMQLKSLFSHDLWPKRGWLSAECRCPSTDPPLGHGCGVHATNARLQTFLWATAGTHMAYGEVALFGEVHEHELGYRAEFAFPISIYTLSLAGAGEYVPMMVAHQYDVPLVMW